MGIPSSCGGSICRRDSLTCSKANSSLLSRIQCLHCLLWPSPSFSFSMVECWFAPRLLVGEKRKNGTGDLHLSWLFKEQHATQCQARHTPRNSECLCSF